MAKKITLEITEAQLRALMSIIDTTSSGMQECPITMKEVVLVDRMLKKNGYKRNFN